MKQREFIDFAAKRGNFSKRIMRLAFEAITTSIADLLMAGETLNFRDFGKFTLEVRKARTAQDINKGKTMILPPSYVVKFTPSKRMRDVLAKMHVPEEYEYEYDDKVRRKTEIYEQSDRDRL